jgi:hypothetical protein
LLLKKAIPKTKVTILAAGRRGESLPSTNAGTVVKQTTEAM